MGKYMNNKKAFTLLEILIAAAIMSVLALFGTASYRHAVSETRVQDAKNRLQAVANAMQRYMLDHPNVNYSAGSDTLFYIPANDASLTVCPRLDGSNFVASALIQCGYLENRAWTTPEVSIATCGTYKEGNYCTHSAVDSPLACMAVMTSRIDSTYAYSNNSNVYCINETEGKWRSE